MSARPQDPEPSTRELGEATALLRMSGIVKTFPGVRALDGVDLVVRPGEVHCLLGQNGAGKSTLIKVLAGAHRPDSGQIQWLGEPVSLSTPEVAISLGISTIYQELDLVPGLSVAENIFLGHELSRGGLLRRADTRRAGRSLLARLGHEEIRVDREVGTLPASGQQIVSMARALSHDTRLIVMDEPSAALDQQEVQSLFRLIRDLTSQGIAVVYISHRLEEIRQVGDRVTVLKDGRTVATDLPARGTPTAELIRLMTGRDIEYVFPSRPQTDSAAATVLEVSGLSLAKTFADVSFSVCAGEIVGLAGWSAPGARRSWSRSTAPGDPPRVASEWTAGGSARARSARRSGRVWASLPRSARARGCCWTRRSTRTSRCPASAGSPGPGSSPARRSGRLRPS